MSQTLSSRLAAMNIHYFRHSLTRFLDDAAALGFARIELWAGMPHLSLDDASATELRDVRRMIAARDLSLSCFTPEQCVYPINLASEHPGTARRSFDYFRRALHSAASLDCRQLLVTAGWGYADAPASDAWERARDQLGALADEAAREGVTLLLEPLSRTESNLITTSAELARMMAELASPQVAAILDLNAMAAAGETPADYLARFGDALRHVHVCDGTPEGHLAWGDGSLPLAQYVAELEAADYQGDYSFEFVSQAYWLDPRTPLESARAAMLQAA
ncbi:sugar phosphate isomerase/epimerase family protein [Salipiger bermudensis]|uniref:sugar phosphate isomerase/epimerase family protein n=1 Tax=Salipiger bermudensis TaxID=344736 RepID=UPI001CD60D0B|nr:sugar phosphate isomerase/epimerase family protein [Salipiger bermudensis]MCA1286977.1 sugar phosphate isomerase/epimerase [Salipiger bermudensis]